MKGFRNKILSLCLFAVAILFMPYDVLAAEVAEIGSTKYDSLEAAIDAASADDTIKILDNIDYGTASVYYVEAITKAVTIDLNGYEIKANADYGVFYVSGGTLTINDSSASKTGKIYNTDKTTFDGIDVKNGGTVIINGGTVYGYYAGIYLYKGTESKRNTLIMNGGTVEAEFYGVAAMDYGKATINGGTITSSGYSLVNQGSSTGPTEMIVNDGAIIESNSIYPAIYHAGPGTLTVNGGTITGGTGIEMRAGTLNIPDDSTAVITGTGTPTEVLPQGNGATSTGVGIAVSQHITGLDLIVNIAGGTIKGYSAFYESNPNGNSAEAIAKVKVNITNGNFSTNNGGTVAVYSENIEDFISGGVFNTSVDDSYVNTPDGYVSRNVDSDVVVAKNIEVIIPTADMLVDIPDLPIWVINSKEVEEYLYNYVKNSEDATIKQLRENDFVYIYIFFSPIYDEEIKAKLDKGIDSGKIAEYYDISFIAVNSDEEIVHVFTDLEIDVKFGLALSEDMQSVPNGYLRNFGVLRSHNETIKKLTATKSSDGTYVEFESNLFSPYALVYEDVKNPNTGDNIGLYVITGIISVIGLFSTIMIINKKKVFNN